MRIKDRIIQDEFAWYFKKLVPTSSEGNVKEQHMRIYI